jgi:hypothetical protein
MEKKRRKNARKPTGQGGKAKSPEREWLSGGIQTRRQEGT